MLQLVEVSQGAPVWESMAAVRGQVRLADRNAFSCIMAAQRGGWGWVGVGVGESLGGEFSFPHFLLDAGMESSSFYPQMSRHFYLLEIQNINWKRIAHCSQNSYSLSSVPPSQHLSLSYYSRDLLT